MKLYIAGPMTGYPEWNFPAFREAARELRMRDFEMVSPAEMDEQDFGFDGTGEPPRRMSIHRCARTRPRRARWLRRDHSAAGLGALEVRRGRTHLRAGG